MIAQAQTTVLSEMTEEECVEFIIKNGVYIPKEYVDLPELGGFVKSIIQKIEADPYYMFVYGDPENQYFCESIKTLVNEHYGAAQNRAPSAPAPTRYTLQYSTVIGPWTDDYKNYNCYAYAIGRTDVIWRQGLISLQDIDKSWPIATMAGLVKDDLEALGFSDVKVSDTLPNVQNLQPWQNLICIRVTTLSLLWDYHFMRYDQASEAWYHKPGTSAILKYNSTPSNFTNWKNETRKSDGQDHDGDVIYNSDIYYIVYNDSFITTQLSPATVAVSGVRENISIYGGRDGDLSGIIEIPSAVDIGGITHTVTQIDDFAFVNQTGITSVIIPANVTNIGAGAFNGCNGLTSITVDPANTNYSSSSGVLFNKNQTALLCYPAGKTGSSYTVPGGVTSIGGGAFYGCANLTSISVPAGVTTIGSGVFNGCSSLTAINVDALNANFSSSSGVLYNKNQTALLCYPAGKTNSSYTIPNTVTSIGDYAVFGNAIVGNFWIPYGVTNIGAGAFDGCYYISINVDPLNTVFSSVNGILFNKNQTVLLRYPEGKSGNYTVPNTVTAIESSAFYNCVNLTGVTIPASVTNIGEGAFKGCGNLTAITVDALNTNFSSSSGVLFNKSQTVLLCYPAGKTGSFGMPDSVTSIGNYAFYGCSGLTDINFTINSQFVKIGDYAFEGCINLDITIPPGVTRIGRGAFWNTKTWNNTPNNSVVYVTAGYTGPLGGGIYNYWAVGYKGQDSILTIKASTTNISDCAFADYRALTTVDMPTGLNNIGAGAFSGCINLKRNIESNIFHGNVLYSAAGIPDSMASIENYAFAGCINLASITFGAGSQLTNIGDYAFAGCINLASFSIPSDVTRIGRGAFWNTGIWENTPSNSIVYIGNWAVGYKGTGSHLAIASGTLNISDYAFAACGTLTTATIPAGLTNIGVGAFSGCTSLTDITILSDVTTVGNYAFDGCSNLTIYAEAVSKPAGWASDWNTSNRPVVWFTPGLSYALINGGTEYEVSKGAASAANIVIPALYNGIPVTAIFGFNSAGVAGLTIPESVIFIDSNAFHSSTYIIWLGNFEFSAGTLISFTGNQTSFTVPGYITVIGPSAFANCTNLSELILHDSVTNIGNSAFSGCTGLTGIIIPHSVTSVGSNVFQNVNPNLSITWNYNPALPVATFSAYLTEVIFPNGTTAIPANFFMNCTNLARVTIPSSVTNVDTGAFSGISPSQLSVIWEYNPSFTAFYFSPYLTQVIIPAGTTAIAANAFYNCAKLTSITIPNTVTSIGANAFEGCTGLTSVNIPSSVTSIGNSAFMNCSNLSSVTIQSGVTSIGTFAFLGCGNLTDITIPASVTYLNVTFGNNTYVTWLGNIEFKAGVLISFIGSQTSYTIPPVGINTIGPSAFLNCTNLYELTLTGGLAAIGDYAFSGCSNLISISIPYYVSSVGFGAFEGCTSLTSITLPFIGNTSSGITDTHFGYIFGAASYAGQNSYIPSFLTTVVITNGNNIADYAFSGCTSLTNVTISNNVWSIGFGAFQGCTSLNALTLPFVGNTPYGITNTHFGYIFGAANYNIQSMNIPQSLKTVILTGGNSTGALGDYAFYMSGSGLTSVTLPANINGIGNYAFYGCSGLTSVTTGYIYNFGNYSFQNCSSLTNIEISNAASAIGNYAFWNTGLTGVITFGAGMSSVGDSAFANCMGLTGVVFTTGFGTTSIGGNAFFGCYNIKSAILSGVKSLGSGAFGDCKSLTDVTLSNSLTTMNTNAFAGCSSLPSIAIPEGVTVVGFFAVGACNNLTVYAEAAVKPAGWDPSWNMLNRPVVWGCTLSADKTYVVSVAKSANTISNPSGYAISNPFRSGYTFVEWNTDASGAGTSYSNLAGVPNGTTVYAIWS